MDSQCFMPAGSFGSPGKNWFYDISLKKNYSIFLKQINSRYFQLIYPEKTINKTETRPKSK